MPPSNRGDIEESPWVDQTSIETFALVERCVYERYSAQSNARMVGSSLGSGVLGAEALAFIQAHRVDMVFMDCEMPVIDWRLRGGCGEWE